MLLGFLTIMEVSLDRPWNGGISQMQGGAANIPQTYYINILPDVSVDSVAACECLMNHSGGRGGITVMGKP